MKNENIIIEKIKNALIALTQVSDMAIPQRIYEIKDIVKNNFPVKIMAKIAREYVRINDHYDELLNTNKSDENKIKDVEMWNYDSYKKTSGKGIRETRRYHYFNNLHTQIAIATIIHDKKRLKGIHNFYKQLNFEVRTNLKMTVKKTNYGNISFSSKSENKCESNSKSLSGSVYRPFYKPWQKKWNKFLERITNLEYEDVYILKLDFKSAYNKLNLTDYDAHELMKEIDDKDKGEFLKLIELTKLYKAKNVDAEKKEIERGVPYGGNVESHMVANALLLLKIHEFCKLLIEKHSSNDDGKNNEKPFKILDVISYADDTCIVFDKAGYEYGAFKEFINEVISKYNDDKGEETIHCLKGEENGKGKTYLFDVEQFGDYKAVREAYTSLSTINAIFLSQKLSDNNFQIEMDSDSKTAVAQRFDRKNLVVRIQNSISVDDLMRPDVENTSFISAMTLSKNFKNRTQLIKMAIVKYPDKKYVLKIIRKFIHVNQIKDNRTDILNELILIHNHLFEDGYFELSMFLMGYIKFVKDEEAKDLFNSSNNKDENNESRDEGDKDESFFGKDWEILFDVKGETLHLLNLYMEWHLNWSNNNSDKVLFNEVGATNKIPPINESKNLLNHIRYNTGKIKSQNSLISHIKKVASYESCSFQKISVSDNLSIINDSSTLFGIDKIPGYWSYTKKILHYYFSKIFEKCKTVLYWRFMRALTSSTNRIEYIEQLKYLSLDIEDMADINEMFIDETDEDYFKLISWTIQKNSIDNNELDKLVLIRQLTKLLWENGSISTQTYTIHNDKHGDVLLKRFNELKAIEKIRNLVKSDDYDASSLVASFYLHDIGMLLNIDYDNNYSGKIKDIYNEISGKIRAKHGRNSAQIVVNRIASLLGIEHDWIVSIQLASIGHEVGFGTLTFPNNKIKVNAAILSIVDLLDITFERSLILSRMLTASFASDLSKLHWQKHYVTKYIDFKYSEETSQLIGTIYLNKKITSQYDGKTLNELEKFITRDIDKYMNSTIQTLIKAVGGQIPKDSTEPNIWFKTVFNYGQEWSENHRINYYDGKNNGLDNIAKLMQEINKDN